MMRVHASIAVSAEALSSLQTPQSSARAGRAAEMMEAPSASARIVERIVPSRKLCWEFRCGRSEEHTSELQSRSDLVCRLLLEKKKKQSDESGVLLRQT